MHNKALPDQHVRELALDPVKSFIIQAPAGSGKTELLTRRILSLLTTVEKPEQILALTFTRKAASEMRERLLAALEKALDAKPTSDTGQWQLAQRVLQHSEKHQWDLLNNPNRLRICTIDAWCHYLVSQMPLLAKFGNQPKIAPDAYPLYREAARNCLLNLYEQSYWQQPLMNLLQHLDNQHEAAIELMIDMIAKREQWLDIVMAIRQRDDRRELCETTLQTLVTEIISNIAEQLPTECQATLSTCLHFAAQHIEDPESPIRAWQEDTTFPAIDASNIKKWLAIAELLLTKQETYRQSVTKTIGFPAPSSTKNAEEKAVYTQHKQNFKDLLAKVSNHELLRQHLISLQNAPPIYYEDEQWNLIETLLQILPLLIAECQLVFSRHNAVDFSEISLRAYHALGEIESPSELALRVDQQLTHILIDEFQDTSQSQCRLLENLTNGWEIGDGRSLFLVGDPMQSIYRFRQAEVGLFCQVQQSGLGNIQLTALNLTSNFRSQADLVEWTNQHFAEIFPPEHDIQLGAIPHSRADTIHSSQANSIHYHRCQTPHAEAQQVVALAKQATNKVGILVRARTHLTEITAALKHADLDYHAVELESLAWQPVVQDCWALTRACHHLADRVAWLAILRAPWCGLSLSSIHHLVYQDHAACIWQQCIAYRDGLIAEDEERLLFLMAVMQEALKQKQKLPLRDWIENTWYALNAPSYLSAHEIEHAEQFFNLLEQFDEHGLLNDFEEFERRLSYLFAQSPAQNANIHVMTIHKAKGLEFDTVILPGLNRQSRPDDDRLFYWHSVPQNNEILLAPIHAKQGKKDPIYHYLRHREKQKNNYEQARLLYVAVTRARSSLHLCYHMKNPDEEELSPPSKTTNLHLLWPTLQHELAASPLLKSHSTRHTELPSCQRVSTITLPTVTKQAATLAIEPQWQDSTASIVGQFCHRIFRLIALQGLTKWKMIRVMQSRMAWKNALISMGINLNELESALSTVERATKNILSDKNGRFILSPHSQAHCEYEISYWENDILRTYIIDRTFVDEHDSRWIIDYKISHSDQDNDQYTKQLNQYGKLLANLSEHPIKLALYYPLQTTLKTWDFHHE